VRRREVLFGISSAALAFAASAWVNSGFAQQSNRAPRVVTLWTTTQQTAAPYITEIEEELRQRGWVPGQTLIIEHRFTDAQPDRLSTIAAEVVASKPDVIMTGLNTGAIAVRKLTMDIPIVVGTSIDPVGAGLALSLARPGGNVTGNAVPPDAVEKRIQVAREVIPELRRIAGQPE